MRRLKELVGVDGITIGIRRRIESIIGHQQIAEQEQRVHILALQFFLSMQSPFGVGQIGEIRALI